MAAKRKVDWQNIWPHLVGQNLSNLDLAALFITAKLLRDLRRPGGDCIRKSPFPNEAVRHLMAHADVRWHHFRAYLTLTEADSKMPILDPDIVPDDPWEALHHKRVHNLKHRVVFGIAGSEYRGIVLMIWQHSPHFHNREDLEPTDPHFQSLAVGTLGYIRHELQHLAEHLHFFSARDILARAYPTKKYPAKSLFDPKNIFESPEDLARDATFAQRLHKNLIYQLHAMEVDAEVHALHLAARASQQPLTEVLKDVGWRLEPKPYAQVQKVHITAARHLFPDAFPPEPRKIAQTKSL